MQHWHIYRKWNERLFTEMHQAYLDGRSEKGPGMNWYYGELGFFDFYIIPLAKKLSSCGVFGVSSDEYLNYALENRREWEKKGRDVVRGYLDRLAEKEGGSAAAVHVVPSPTDGSADIDVVVRVVNDESAAVVCRSEEDLSLHRIKTNIDMPLESDSDDEGSSTFEESESTQGSVEEVEE
jgi:hypothetical protein